MFALTVFTISALALPFSKEELAENAVSPDKAIAAEAIRELRGLGQSGLDALFTEHSGAISKFSTDGFKTDEWQRVAAALDSVAMQKDVFASRLFWHTDLNAAKAEAKKTGKPILTLRLLGNLNDEFSCANSRFFRALLYSNSAISKELRENYVLHWKSVRPAPRVTIDFGDGRKLERTITGNSIHYILDSNGAVIDAIPGLYSPQMFLGFLNRAAEFNTASAKLTGQQRDNALLRYRKTAFDAIVAKRSSATTEAGVTLKESESGTKAMEVAPLAVTKMITEVSILRDISDDFSKFGPSIDLDEWQRLASKYAGATEFDQSSRAFIRRQNLTLNDAQMKSLVDKLGGYVAVDATKNDFMFRTKLFEWLNRPTPAPFELERFNTRVYNELFKTPEGDQWLGLYTTDVYTALDGNGIVKN